MVRGDALPSRCCLGPVFFILILLTIGATCAQAEPAGESWKKLLQLSDQAFVGRVVETSSYRSGTFIRTRYTFVVEDSLWGSPGGVAFVDEFGGQVGDTVLRVSHGVSYRQGRRYLVFSAQQADGTRRTVMGDRGALPVAGDTGDGATVQLGIDHPLQSLFSDRSTPRLVGLVECISELQSARTEGMETP